MERKYYPSLLESFFPLEVFAKGQAWYSARYSSNNSIIRSESFSLRIFLSSYLFPEGAFGVLPLQKELEVHREVR
ncbi:hypothetical protein AKJ57_05800 [candidate division MSBL1 archaeon SCGC-AAA259A05]|uniref:Uncharacterized protein n=1 Tax=candidate division MSBL1 archaeon SCGC-AAA259A05 TaxID=1698259 RepID=A0A133U4N7_9EURY|nr:hypothetical protein AKJ57_05800 [candidate division MSBL1 archaeon SCGC-AAA259A05]